MTACNGCGRCCDPVALPYRVAGLTPDDLEQFEPANLDWVTNHLTEITPRRRGLQLVADYMPTGMTSGMIQGQPFNLVTFFYTCDWYDQENRQCTAYDQRPPMCSGYPWYDGEPEAKAMPLECSFRADIGRSVKPMS